MDEKETAPKEKSESPESSKAPTHSQFDPKAPSEKNCLWETYIYIYRVMGIMTI